MQRLFAVLLFCFACVCLDNSAYARPGHGGAASGIASQCYTYTAQIADDGCVDAPAGLFFNTGLFTNARQAGQGQYYSAPGVHSDHPPPFNVAAVDYGIANYTDDAHLVDISSNIPSGCSLVTSGPYIRCNTTQSLAHYRFNDIGYFQAGGGLTLDDFHFTMGRATCRSFTGGAPFTQTSGSAAMIVTSGKMDFSSECQQTAHLYKKATDPGLATLATFNLTIASNTLTVNGSATGFIAVGEYLDWPGIGTDKVKITANVSPGGVTNCTGAACASSQWTVCKVDPASSTDACNQSAPNVGPIAGTTGPIEPSLNIPLKRGNGVGTPVIGKYLVALGYPAMFNDTGGGNNSITNSYLEIDGCCGEHNNFVVQQPNTGGDAHVELHQDFNVDVYKATSQPTGTAMLTTFTTSQNANTTKPSGYQITVDKSTNNYNVLIANPSLNSGSPVANTAAIFRYLSQGPTPASAVVKYTLSGGVATVTEFTSGAPLEVGEFLFCSGCASPAKITSFGTGTGGIGTYNVTNTTDTKSTPVSASAFFYPGIIGTYEAIGNYIDWGGALAPFSFDDGETFVTTRTISGNVNMSTGNACTDASCN